MSMQSLTALFEQFSPGDEQDVSVEIPLALQSAFTVLQTIMAISQTEGPRARLRLLIPAEWHRLQELADDYSTQMGLNVNPRVYGDVTVKGYSPTALRYAHNQILTKGPRSTYVLH